MYNFVCINKVFSSKPIYSTCISSLSVFKSVKDLSSCLTNSFDLEVSTLLTLYDPGGGFKSPPIRFFALTHLILELHYCALVTFPKK